MAKGTIYGTTSNSNIKVKIEWTSTAYPEGNYSDVSAALYYKKTTDTTTYGTGSFSIDINGTSKSEYRYIEITDDGWVKAIEYGSPREPHKTDGTQTIPISASGSISGTTLESTSVSGKAKLDTIARESSITSASNVTLGNACNVKWIPNSKDYRYKLKFTLGGWSYTTGVIHPNQTTVYTYTGYPIPLDVANQLPKAKTGTMKVTLYTFSDSAATKQIGSADTSSFKITIPDNDSTKPKATMTISLVSSLPTPFNSLYIKGKSKVDANFTDIESRYEADIVSCKMSVDGKSYGSPYTSDFLSKPGPFDVVGTITDSRGFTREYPNEITVIDYDNPLLLPIDGESKIICARCDAEGNLSESGTHLRIKAKRSYSPVMVDDTQKNFCALRYRCVPEGTKFSGDEGWVTLLEGKTTTIDTVDETLSGVVSSTETAYMVQVGVVDDMGFSAAVQFMIPTDFATVDIPDKHKGRRIGVGRYAEDSDEPGIDIGIPIHGGSVDNLTLGDLITATASSPIDLNDYKIPGNYYSPSATNSEYISNSPYNGGGFGLEVRELQSKNYIRQTLYYGRTTWIRHWDGKEWSVWARILATEADSSFAADFVIEEGIANGWTYKKWKSGTYEMYGIFDVTTTEKSTAIGTNMFYSEQFKIPAPFAIKRAIVAGTATNWFIPTTGGLSNGDDGEDPNEYIGFRLCHPSPFDVGRESSIRLHVTGEYE